MPQGAHHALPPDMLRKNGFCLLHAGWKSKIFTGDQGCVRFVDSDDELELSEDDVDEPRKKKQKKKKKKKSKKQSVRRKETRKGWKKKNFRRIAYPQQGRVPSLVRLFLWVSSTLHLIMNLPKPRVGAPRLCGRLGRRGGRVQRHIHLVRTGSDYSSTHCPNIRAFFPQEAKDMIAPNHVDC